MTNRPEPPPPVDPNKLKGTSPPPPRKRSGIDPEMANIQAKYTKLLEENMLLRRMVDGVRSFEYADFEFDDIDGKNWFDLRQEITGREHWK